jgi:hypothetical protein
MKGDKAILHHDLLRVGSGSKSRPVIARSWIRYPNVAISTCVLFVQAAWLVLVKVKAASWEATGSRLPRSGCIRTCRRTRSLISSRIAWSVVARGRAFEVSKVSSRVITSTRVT